MKRLLILLFALSLLAAGCIMAVGNTPGPRQHDEPRPRHSEAPAEQREGAAGDNARRGTVSRGDASRGREQDGARESEGSRRPRRTPLDVAPSAPPSAPDANNFYSSGAPEWSGPLPSVVITDRFETDLRAAGGDKYAAPSENAFRSVKAEPLSTFSIDVDTASYSNVRRFLREGQLPPAEAVRVEELINYFSYDYPPAKGRAPFSLDVEVAECPWNLEHRLVRIGMRAREVDRGAMPPSNLVFLVDVSGSMATADKLPLLKSAFRMLTENLGARDSVAVVVYAGAVGLALPPTSGDNRELVLDALANLEAGGSTNGGQGIELAYRLAEENFITGGINRVILATDGDFNVGVTAQGDLVKLAEEKAKGGVFLSILGFGRGNLNDAGLEQIANKGNGHYAYIDSELEARRVLVEQVGGTLFTVAKDVKLQVEFNPTKVQGYRLIGYENRMLNTEDFADDQKDAGELGAGHTVTALYEVVPPGVEFGGAAGPGMRYREEPRLTAAAFTDELMTVNIRYKEPEGRQSLLVSVPVRDAGTTLRDASDEFLFAASVAGFGMLLRQSPHAGEITWESVAEMAESARGSDRHGHREEFVKLVRQAQGLSPM